MSSSIFTADILCTRSGSPHNVLHSLVIIMPTDEYHRTVSRADRQSHLEEACGVKVTRTWFYNQLSMKGVEVLQSDHYFWICSWSKSVLGCRQQWLEAAVFSRRLQRWCSCVYSAKQVLKKVSCLNSVLQLQQLLSQLIPSLYNAT